MKSRKLILSAVLLMFLMSGFANAKRLPNVVLIMADDVSWECFGCYGAEDYQTPNIDALAAKGVKFNHCYSTPLCTPSRVKMMTGKYNFRNYTHFGYLNPEEKTFGQVMQAAGYKTAIAGKWQLNGLYHEAEGCRDNTRPYKAGFDEYCLWQLTQRITKTEGSERFWSPLLEQNGKILSQEDNEGKYGPDIMSDFICDFIEENKGQPFFAYYPTVLVHNPFVPTPDNIGSLPRTAEANKAPKSKATQKENFVAMVNYLDKIVGEIVKKLEETGQIDNTIIMFTADNGTNRGITSTWNGQQIKGGKGNTTDMGTHVPLVAYWKGHTPKGVVSDDLIDFTDFYKTIADAAKVKLKEDDPIDGYSFLPQLKGRKDITRDWVLCHYQPYWARFAGRQFARNQQFKLYEDGRLYDIANDLEEVDNLVNKLTNDAEVTIKQKLQKILDLSPSAPPNEGGRNATYRPTYPNWINIVNPDD